MTSPNHAHPGFMCNRQTKTVEFVELLGKYSVWEYTFLTVYCDSKKPERQYLTLVKCMAHMFTDELLKFRL